MELQIAEQSKLRLTPNTALIIASIIALSAFLISAWIAIHQPWLGISLVGSDKGLRIVEVADNGPSTSILSPGDIILKLAGQKGSPVQLQPRDIIEDPDAIPTFSERDTFRDRQAAIYRILLQPVVSLFLEDGRVMRVQPQTSRPLTSMPAEFWILAFYSIAALLIGAAIWGVNQKYLPARYLLLSGLGVTFVLNIAKIINLRELALDGNTYQVLTFFYHLGNYCIVLGIIGLIWCYPKKISHFSLLRFLMIYMAFFMLNENFEWTELPGNSVLIQVPRYIVLAIIILIIQWLKSRKEPLDRAIIKLMIFMTLLITFGMSGTYLTSVFHVNLINIGQNIGFSAIFIMFISLAGAVQRYHLFDIDRWWIEMWLWFFTGVVIVVFDMVLVSMANMASSYALAASVIVVGWLYFPVRQWVWTKLFHRKRDSLEKWIPLLVGRFMHVDHGSDQHVWEKVLNDVFHPLSIELKQQGVTQVQLTGDGVCLLTPCLVPECGMELYYANKGRRLFNRDDINLAQALFNITKQAMVQQENYKHGMLEERKRIMRDLHDDIGGRLLTLMHTESDKSGAITEALKSLREIIYSLDTEQQMRLNISVAKWRIEAMERCEQANIACEWRWEELEKDINLAPRQHLNLTLMMREGLSNMLKHAKAKRNMVDLHVEEGVLQVTLTNDGGEAGSEQIKFGKGLRNMRARTEELGGKFRYTYEAGVFRVKFSVPVNEREGVIDV